jgi:Flp pilus assembly protein TadD
MRRLYTSRDPDPDTGSVQGFDSLLLEGDPRTPTPDAVSSLRPFGRDLADPGLGPAPMPEGASAPPGLVRARHLVADGRRLEATQVLLQFVADQPDRTEGRIALADLLEEAGDEDGALDQLTEALRIESDRAGVLIQRGALHARMGRAALAERDLRAAVGADPSSGVAYRYLGTTLLRRGRAGEAIGVLRDAERLAPDDGDVKLALGEALAADGQVAEALAVMEAAAQAAPADARPWTAIGRLLDRLGRSEEALTMHKKARELGRPR